MYNGSCLRGLSLLLFCIDLFKSSTSYNVSDANTLLVKLFDQNGYNKLIQPQKQVNIYASYNLLSVNSLDIKKQIFSTTGFFILQWSDDRLKWDDTSYGDIYEIYLPIDRVWHPDFIVLNSIHELQKNLGDDRRVRINKYGHLVWKASAILSTFCLTHVYFFPFDRQLCSLNLITLDHTFLAVKLQFFFEPMNIKSHVSQTDWRVVRTFYFASYIWDETDFSDMLLFQMVLERLPGHYIMIVIFPTILTAVLTYVTFFLPLKTGVRIGYIVTVVLAYVVLLTLFADTLPSSTQYPSVLVVFFAISLGMAFFLIIITVFVMRLYNKPKQSIAPNWMHTVVRKSRKLTSKLKCRARNIKPAEQNQTIEDDKQTGGKDSVGTSVSLKPYSNKELAEYFDYLLFVVFTVLYSLVLVSIPIVTVVWFNKASSEYNK